MKYGAKYATYRDKCLALANELADLKAKRPANEKDVTIKYLLESAEAFLSAADVIIEMREDAAKEAK
jgi:hypothetical protein